MDTDFDAVSLDTLRRRRSEKWLAYPRDVLPAFVAEMDVPLAEPIAAALHEAVSLGDTGYARGAGLAEAFADFARSWMDWSVDPSRITIVPDVMIGVAEAVRVVTDPGDRVVITPPVYPPFWPTLREYGREPFEVPLLYGRDGWDLDLDAIERAFAEGARAFLLCNPHNPTGRVYTRAQLERIAAMADRYDVAVISDEIHGLLVLPGARHVPFVSLGDRAARKAVTVTSASKAFNVAGLKCALVIAGSDEMRDRFRLMPEELVGRTGHLGVLASIAAFREGGAWLRALIAHLDRNRRLMAELLADRLPTIGYFPPQASFLAWLDCRELGLGDDPSATFLERGRVALVRGLNFGREGAGYARLNIATSAQLLKEAVERMAAVSLAAQRG
jgi:cystathionine beta-lyase